MVVLCYLLFTKPLEYKVRPYGLLFSCYILCIRSFLRGQKNCDTKPTDGATTFSYLRTGEKSGID
jgi:hypothetical protein